VIHRGVQVLHDHRILDCGAWPLVGGFVVHEFFLHPSAEYEDRAGCGEMSVHAVVLRFADDVGDVDRLILHLFVYFPFRQRVVAELVGEHDECAIEQPAFLEVANELCDWCIDQLLHRGCAFVFVFVAVLVEKGNVFRGDFDKVRVRFDQVVREQVVLAEMVGVVGVEGLFGFEGEVECFC